jgi:hypothetical protein
LTLGSVSADITSRDKKAQSRLLSPNTTSPGGLPVFGSEVDVYCHLNIERQCEWLIQRSELRKGGYCHLRQTSSPTPLSPSEADMARLKIRSDAKLLTGLKPCRDRAPRKLSLSQPTVVEMARGRVQPCSVSNDNIPRVRFCGVAPKKPLWTLPLAQDLNIVV